jgi:hypothetical protein
MPRISQLNNASAPTGVEDIPVVQNGQTVKLNLDQIRSWLQNAPTDMEISTDTVYENTEVGALVAVITTTGAQAGSVFTYSIIAGDDAFLEMSGPEVRVKALFTQAAKPTLTITVRVTETVSGNFYDEAFTFTVLQGLGQIPVNTVLPSFTGVPEVGVPFTFTPGTWTTDSNTSFEYQILFGPNTVIEGATGLTFTPQEGDEGQTLRIRVRALAVGRNPVEVLSAETPAILAADDPEAEGPVTSLTAIDVTPTSVRLIFPAQDPALRWQWRYKITSGGSYSTHTYFTPTNYTPDGTVKQTTVNGLPPDTDEIYFQHRWEISTGNWSRLEPTNSTEVRVDTPAETASVGPPTNDVLPVLSFNPASLVPGSVASVTNGTWTANPAISGFEFAFDRRNSSNQDTEVQAFSSAEGANQYTTVTADLNHRIVARVRATNSEGSTVQASLASGLIQEAVTPGTPTEDYQIEMFPPNLDNPAVVSIAQSNFYQPVSVTGDVLQDAIFTSAVGIQERNHYLTITGFAQGWLENFNFGPGGFLRYYHGRGEKWNHKVQFFALGGPQSDPFWVQTNVAENGLTHRLTRAGFYCQTAPGTWYANNAFHIILGNCNAAGQWTIDAYAEQNVNYATLPAVGDVWEIYSNQIPAANKRWFRIDSLSQSSALGDRRFTITATDVTEPGPSNKVISNLRYAACGYAIREFKRVSGTNTIRFVKAFSGGTPQGLQVNGVRKANGDPWPEASDIWHINSFNSGTQTATVSPRTTHSSITSGDWTTTEVRAAAYASQHNTGSGTITNHPDIVQVLEGGTHKVEVIELNGRALYTYQYLRHNTWCKKFRMSNMDVERVDQWDMPYVFPIVRTSQGLDLQGYGSTYGMIREFNNVRWKADRGRNLVQTQVAEPNMAWLVENVSVYYPPGTTGAPGTTGHITVWDGSNPKIELDEVFTIPWTFTGPADTAPTGINWRIIATNDIRNAAANTVLAERFIQAPRRGHRFTVTMTNTAGGRFQIHTNSRGPTRCIAKGSTAIAAGTHRIAIRVQSPATTGRTQGFDVTFQFDVVVNSSGVITAINAV